MKKDLIMIIRSQDGTFKKTLSVFTMSDFSKYINGGLSDLAVKVPITMDSTDIGDYINVYNDIEIRMSDIDTPSQGKTIYRGYISSYGPYVKGHEEGTELYLLPYTTLLSDDLFEEDYVCLDFVGANSDQVDVADNAAHDVTSALTVECWFKTTMTPAAGGTGLVLHDYSQYKYLLYLIGTDGKNINFAVRSASGVSSITAYREAGWNDGNWHYVVGVWEKPYLRIYVDGKLYDSIQAYYNEDITAGDEGLTIGRLSTNFYTGSMMNVRVSNIARRGDEISMNWKKGQKLKNTNAFACYHFDEGTGTTVTDETGTQNGTITGADWLTGQKSRSTINKENVDPGIMLRELVDSYNSKHDNSDIKYIK